MIISGGTGPKGAIRQDVLITSLSRDAGSAAGGATVVVNGSGFVEALVPVVYFGTDAAETTFVDTSHLYAVTPAHAAGQVDVSVNQAGDIYTLTGILPNGGKAFEYEPAPVDTYVSHDFEDGTLGGFSSSVGAGSVLTVDTVVSPISGTKAAICTYTGEGNPSSDKCAITFAYTPKQPPLEATGLYQRWYMRVNAAFLAGLSVAGVGQVKILLDRAATNPPSWFASVLGSGISLVYQKVFFVADWDSGLIPGGCPAFTISADTWVELQTHFVRSGSSGRSRLWVDGKLLIDYSDAGAGTDDDTKQMTWTFGMAYCQDCKLNEVMVMHVDNAAAADGFLDP